MHTKMKVAKLYPDAILPTRKHLTDAGLDLYAYIKNEYGRGVKDILPNTFSIINTGIVVKIPDGYFGWITNKGKSNYLIGGGIVDEGYQGELLVKVINPNNYTEYIYEGDAIAQLLIIPCKILDIEEAALSTIFEKKSDRSADGGIVRQVLPYSKRKSIPIDDNHYDYMADDMAYDAARERMFSGRHRD